jgi:hypothetical protein
VRWSNICSTTPHTETYLDDLAIKVLPHQPLFIVLIGSFAGVHWLTLPPKFADLVVT